MVIKVIQLDEQKQKTKSPKRIKHRKEDKKSGKLSPLEGILPNLTSQSVSQL